MKKLTGENSLICGVIERLKKVVNKVPHDVESTVLEIMQTTSVDDFNSVLKTLEANLFLGLRSDKQKFVEEMLILAEVLYTRLL
jgi:hypothetical protein